MIEGRDSNFSSRRIRTTANNVPQLKDSDIYQQNQAIIIQLRTKNN
jgi:hypothetical protein